MIHDALITYIESKTSEDAYYNSKRATDMLR